MEANNVMSLLNKGPHQKRVQERQVLVTLDDCGLGAVNQDLILFF